ncbi:MAG: esterase-like activity of phytase family protein [Granulosicoccus sp.]
MHNCRGAEFGNHNHPAFPRINPNWNAGSIDIVATSLLHDPDVIVPFRIVHEGTEQRYLTGGDFDPESIQIVGDTVWIGEGFGPYLIRTTLDGRVTGLFETEFEVAVPRSPDYPQVPNPSVAGVDFQVPRSGGFEDLALTHDGRSQWAMLEKPALDARGYSEGSYLQVLEFDLAQSAWTGDSFRYALDEGAAAIGDFNFIDDTRALVIERDNGEGDPSLACADVTQPQPDCFPAPARFKRVVLIDTQQLDDDGLVRKLAHIDLMDIEDPSTNARLDTEAARDSPASLPSHFLRLK